jgi:5-methylthioadenosine/S-adenosylhomocysteine deaminase
MGKYLFIAIILSVQYFSVFSQFSSQSLSPNNFQRKANESTPVVLRGTIITPEGVIRHGYVAIANGWIISVSEKQPDLPNAINVNTHGIILPGFVDVHNHVRWNVLPRWSPGRFFTNRNQWRNDPAKSQLINRPIDDLEPLYFCDMNAWGELRALVGGTTSIMATESQPCIHGLVRNLDYNSGFYGTTELNLEHIFNVIDIPPADSPSARAFFVGAARSFINNPFYEALFVHLAEGTDAAAEEEFTFVNSRSLLNPKGAIIHGIPLSATDFQAMARNGTALVWSPRSNLELYGKTANIEAALDAGVEIALAPDWAITGSSNMLDELKVAARWNHEHLADRLTDRQLVDMVTSIPAHIAGVDDHVGAISPGLRADILVINGDQNYPYHAIVDATVADVELVFIGGVPLYGDRTFMERFWKRSELEEIKLPEATKTIATPAANLVVAEIEKRLQSALVTEGTSLAPLTEADPLEVATSRAAQTRVSLGKLTVTALPNPSSKDFTLITQSSSNKTLQLRVRDVLGRAVETRNGIEANTTFRIGTYYRPGLYLVEVVQGTERQILKLTRR